MELYTSVYLCYTLDMATQSTQATKSLQNILAKRCFTVSGWLVHDKRILLVRHKMLQTWLAPGGHVEKNELPHRAVEREFFEETGLKVRAISAYPMLPSDQYAENLPLPFSYNLHWINHPGEKKARTNGDICEQHYSFGFLVEATEPLDRIGSSEDPDEGIEGLQWFTLKDLKITDIHENIRREATYAIWHYPYNPHKG